MIIEINACSVSPNLKWRFDYWNVLTHKTFIAYTTDDIGDKWSLINNIESLEQFGQWLVSGGYKENSNYKK